MKTGEINKQKQGKNAVCVMLSCGSCSDIFSRHRKGFLKNAAYLEESIIMGSSLDTKTYFKKLNFCGKDVFRKSSFYCAVKYYSIKCHFADQNYNKK